MAASAEFYAPKTYEPRAMESVEDIGITAGVFADRKGYETMKSLVRDVFLKHGMENTFGIGLLHKHYPLASDERIVQLGPVSSPWVIGASDEIAGGRIFAHTWRVYKGEIRPVEYSFVPHRSVAGANEGFFPSAFAKEIVQILELTGLDDILSIVLVGRSEYGGDTMELTFGRSSIVIPTTKEEEIKILQDNKIEGFQASWVFTNNSVRALHRTCGNATGTDGVRALHRTCGTATGTDGVRALHRTCGDATGTDSVRALHRTCGNGNRGV